MEFSLISIIEKDLCLEPVKIVATREQLYHFLEQINPAVLILNPDMLENRSRNFITKLREQFPKVKVVLLADDKLKEEINDFVSLGIKGFISDSSSPNEIKDELLKILKNEFYFNEQLMHSLVSGIMSNGGVVGKKLTPTELKISEALQKGLWEKEIATKYNISISTVHTHIKNIYKKTGSHSIRDLEKYLRDMKK